MIRKLKNWLFNQQKAQWKRRFTEKKHYIAPQSQVKSAHDAVGKNAKVMTVDFDKFHSARISLSFANRYAKDRKLFPYTHLFVLNAQKIQTGELDLSLFENTIIVLFSTKQEKVEVI